MKTICNATIASVPRELTTKFGQRTVVDIQCSNGTKGAIWGRGGDVILLSLKEGQSVNVEYDSEKNKYELVNDSRFAPVSPSLNGSPIPNNQSQGDRSEEIKDYIKRLLKLYSYCYKQVGESISIDEESRRAIATSLFIQVCKKFEL